MRAGRTYEVASALAEAEIASEIYSIAGDYDVLAKFYIHDDVDIGRFVGEKVQVRARYPRHADDHHVPGVLRRHASRSPAAAAG